MSTRREQSIGSFREALQRLSLSFEISGGIASTPPPARTCYGKWPAKARVNCRASHPRLTHHLSLILVLKIKFLKTRFSLCRYRLWSTVAEANENTKGLRVVKRKGMTLVFCAICSWTSLVTMNLTIKVKCENVLVRWISGCWIEEISIKPVLRQEPMFKHHSAFCVQHQYNLVVWSWWDQLYFIHQWPVTPILPDTRKQEQNVEVVLSYIRASPCLWVSSG